MEGSSSAQKINLPSGVKLSSGYETSELTSAGKVEQGMNYTITLPDGSTSSIFIPYSTIHNLAQVQSLIDTRVNALRAISG